MLASLVDNPGKKVLKVELLVIDNCGGWDKHHCQIIERLKSLAVYGKVFSCAKITYPALVVFVS
jgi:hypothetical protein